MATWKRLTRTSGPQVDVNIDAVLHMQRHQDKHTTLHFSVAVGDKISLGQRDTGRNSLAPAPASTGHMMPARDGCDARRALTCTIRAAN